MKKQLLITTLSILTIATLYPMQIKYKEITNSSIDDEIIKDNVIVQGHCWLEHNVIIKGRLFIAKNSTLAIMSQGTCDRHDKASIQNIKSPISKNSVAICGLKKNNIIFEDSSSTILIRGIVEFNIVEDIYFPTGTLIVASQSALKLTASLGISPLFFPIKIYRTPNFLLRIFDTSFIYENNAVFVLGNPDQNVWEES